MATVRTSERSYARHLDLENINAFCARSNQQVKTGSSQTRYSAQLAVTTITAADQWMAAGQASTRT